MRVTGEIGIAGWISTTAVLVGAVAAALLVHAVLFWFATRVARRPETALEPPFVGRLKRPLLLVLPLLALQATLPAVSVAEETRSVVRHGLAIGSIVGVAWLLSGVIHGLQEAVLARHRVDVRDNLSARRVHTQLRVLARILDLTIVIIAFAAVLMTFPRVRQLGAGLLASAGVVGLVVGFAARPILSNVIAGIQIALAAPIRLDDVVIVEGEWGRIEEINATFVVVKVWDERRLVVPLSWFLENPFQNWTRTTADLLGTVFLYVDYTVPVEALRAELKRICEASDAWDRRVCLVQVTDCKPATLEVRALVSAADSGGLWDLRCAVREGLVAFVSREYPDALPQTRASVQGLSGRSDAGEEA